jgi:hypothetical protein
MARSDHNDPRAVPVDSDGAGLAAQRLMIGLHARQGAAREPTQSHLPRTAHTVTISTPTPMAAPSAVMHVRDAPAGHVRGGGLSARQREMSVFKGGVAH